VIEPFNPVLIDFQSVITTESIHEHQRCRRPAIFYLAGIKESEKRTTKLSPYSGAETETNQPAVPAVGSNPMD